MKLKRLLSGVTAAIMAFSAVAITSFTTASAALEKIQPTNGWYGSDEGTLEGDQLKLIQLWNSSSTFPQIKDKKFYVAFEVKGVSPNTTAFIALSNGNDVQAWDSGVKNPTISTPKNGKYVLSFEGNTSEITQFMCISFKKDGEKDYGITSAKLIGCYLEDPTEELGIGAGGGDDEPDPASSIVVRLIDNDANQLGTQTVTVDKDGQYELSVDGFSLAAGSSAITLRSTEAVKGTLADENATLTVDEITVNGTAVDVPSTLKNISPWGWDAPDDIKADIYNAWNAAASIKLPAGVTTISSMSVKFTLKNIIKKADPNPGPNPTPGNGKVIAAPFFTDGDYYPAIDHSIKVEINGNGQYQMVIPALAADGTETDVSGVVCLVIDFLDCKNDYSFKAVLDSITCAGKEIDVDPSKAIFGDIEDDNDHLRLEIYNEYGDTKIQGGAIDPLDVDYKVGEEMVITFTISDFEVIKKPSNNPSGNKPSATAPSKKPTTGKATRSADQVKKDKTAAQKAMKQAKLSSLKVKSKAKKKVNVTWKKVKKATGYQVQVSTKKNFKKVIFKKDLKKTKLTIKNKKIKSKKTYFVRVRAYATYKDTNNKTVKVFSKWNKKLRKVKVK